MSSKRETKLIKIATQIPAETRRIVDALRAEIKESSIRDKRITHGKKRTTIRLTSEQRSLAKKGFWTFYNTMIEYEKKIGKHYLVTKNYTVFIQGRLALESYTRSMFACFRCGEIVPILELKRDEGSMKHECHDGEFGDGDRTSWLYLYATFVRNQKLKEALSLLEN